MKKHLCKVIVHIENNDDFKVLKKLIKRYNITSVQFYCYLNEQQIRSLKQNKNINIIYGKGLKYNHDNIIIINK